MRDKAAIIDTFAKNNIKVAIYTLEESVYKISKLYDFDNCRDYDEFDRMLATARLENKKRSHDVFHGMVKGVRKGHYQGTAIIPYGFRYDKWQPEEKRKLEIVPEEAKVVVLAFELYANGSTVGEIAKTLYERGYRSRKGGRFHTKFLCDMLKREEYTGTLVWNRKHYDKSQPTRKHYKYVKNPESAWIRCENAHGAIISKELFDKVQELLKRRRKTNCRIVGKFEYPFSGILRCDDCMTQYNGSASITNRTTKRYDRFYRCMGPQNLHNDCENPPVKADEIEKQLAGILGKILQHPTIKERRYNNLSNKAKIIETEDHELEAKIEELERQYRDIKRKQADLTNAYLDKITPKDVYQVKMAELSEQESKVTSEKFKLEACLIQKENSVEYQKLLRTVIENFDETKEALTILDKKELLRLMFKRVSVFHKNVHEVVLYEPFQSMLDEINQGVTTCKASVLQLSLSDGRWEHSHRTILSFLHTIYDEIFVSNEAYLRWVTN
jgi:hypothetical protein